MARDLTVTFDDGSSHVYANAPDDVTFEKALARAQTDFKGKAIKNIDGGRSAAPVVEEKQSTPAAEKPAPAAEKPAPAAEKPAPAERKLGLSSALAKDDSFSSMLSRDNSGIRAPVTAEDYLKIKKEKEQSVLEKTPLPPVAPTEDRAVLNPQFTNAVEAHLNAMPAEERAGALAKLAERPDVYGRAAKAIAGRYQAMDKGAMLQASPTASKLLDPRLEAQEQRFIDKGRTKEQAAIDTMGQSTGYMRPDFQQMTRDVVGEQAGAEAAARAKELVGAGFWERVGAGASSELAKSGAGLLIANADLRGNKQRSNQFLNELRIETEAGKAIPQGESIFEKSAQGAMTSLSTQAPLIALSALTGTPAPVLAQAAIQQFGSSYGEGRAAGLSGNAAATRGIAMATAEVFFERFGMTKALAGLKAHIAKYGVDSIPKYLAKAIATEIPSELATTATQYLTDMAPKIGLNKNPSFADFYKQLEETVRQTVLQAGATAGGTIAVTKGAQGVAKLLPREEQREGAYQRDTSYEGLSDTIARQKGFLTPEQTQQQAPPPPADTDLGAVGEARPGEDNLQPPAPPADIQEQAEPAKETSDRVEKLVKRGVPRADAIAMAEKGETTAGIPTKIDTWTDTALQSTLDLQINKPESERNIRLVQAIQTEIQKRAATQGETQGATDAGQPITTPSGTSTKVVGGANQEPTATGVGGDQRSGVVLAKQNVAGADGREAGKPAAIKPQLPVAQANEPAMQVQDGTRQPVPMSALTTPEALQRAGQVLSVPDKTPENILRELNFANSRGGLATWEIETILGLRDQKQQAPAEVTEIPAELSREEKLKTATNEELEEALTKIGGSDISYLSVDAIQAEIDRRKAEAETEAKQKTETRGRKADAPDVKAAKAAKNKAYGAKRQAAKRAFDENQDNALKQLAEANIPLDEGSFADEESLAQAQEDKRAKKASAINKLLDVEELEHGRPLGKKAKAILNDRTKISENELAKVKKGREVRKKTDLRGEIKTNTPLANRRSTGKVDAKFSKFTNGAQAITHIIRTGNIFQKFLAARLRPFVANVKFVVIERGDSLPSQLREYADDWEESRGLYFGAEEGSKPTIYVRGESFGQDQGINNITVLHELLHAATNTKITLGLLARSRGVSRDAALTNFIGDLSSLMENAKVNYERMLARGMISPQLRVVVESAGEVDPQTGEVTSDIFEIPQEFLAYGMSDENFQDFLDSIEGKSNEGSGWSRFTRMIANLFGLGRGNYTALSDLMHVTDKILSTRATPEMRAMGAGAQAPSAAKLPEDRTEKEKAKAVDYMLEAVDKSKTAEEFSKATSTLQRLRRGDIKGLLRAASGGFTYKQRQALAILLPTPELADIGGIRVPELINTNELLSEMEGLQAQMMEAGANTVTNLMKLLPEQESKDKVNQAVLVSTGAKIDPRVDKSVPKLNDMYNALTDNEKAAYAEVFDYYDNMADYVEYLMEESVKSLGLSDDKTILAAVRDVLHSSNRIKPYAPLLRDQSGDYWLRVGSGNSLEVYTRKSKDERDSLARMIAEERNTTVEQLIDDSEIEVGNKIADMRQKIVDSSDALRKMFLMIDNADFATTDTKPLLKAREGMKDTIFQLWLHMQPENSARKQFMHRAENPPAGFKTDVIQGVAESAIKFSTHVAKLKYGPKLRASISQAKSYIGKDPDATPYVEEMALRVFDTLGPERDSAAMAAVQFANAFTYGYYMTESTALIQLLGGYQMGMAQLAKKHSIVDVTKTMGSFAAVWNSMGVHDANGDWVMPTIVDGARLKNSAKDTPEERLRKESLRAGLEEMKLRNVAESTAVRDLNGYKDIPTERYGSTLEQSKRAARFIVGGLGHAAERLSREIVYASAFSLTRDKALAKFYKTTAYKASTDKIGLTRAFQNDSLKKWAHEAARDTEKALFKYTPSAKPRWMRNAPGKFALQFFTYKLNIGVFLARNLLGMIKPLPGETRTECRRAFTTLMGTTWTLSGVSGMFGVSAVAGLVSMLMRLGRDAEEPDELKDVAPMEAIRIGLDEHLGHITIGGAKLSDIIYKGLLNPYTGLEFASRTSIADIGMPPDIKDTRTLSDGAIEYIKKFAGADLSAFLSVAQGIQMIIEGDTQRGLEKVVPWAHVRNKMIAVRYAMEGETGTKFSDEIVEAEQFHLGELLGQAVGLRPVIVTDVMAANRKATEIINRVTMRRAEILEQIGKADDKGDLDREINWLEKKDKFNDKYGGMFPEMVISNRNVTEFKDNRGERRSRTWAGFEFTDRNQLLADEILESSRAALIKREKETVKNKKEKEQNKRGVSGQLERQ